MPHAVPAWILNLERMPKLQAVSIGTGAIMASSFVMWALMNARGGIIDCIISSLNLHFHRESGLHIELKLEKSEQ